MLSTAQLLDAISLVSFQAFLFSIVPSHRTWQLTHEDLGKHYQV
jgi:hypothetical protein